MGRVAVERAPEQAASRPADGHDRASDEAAGRGAAQAAKAEARLSRRASPMFGRVV